MNHKRLQSMPTGELKKYAQKMGIEFPGNITRDALIEIVVDTLDEAEREKAERNNVLVLGEEKKYEASDDAEFVTESAPPFPLPHRYHKTEGVLMIRDPNWAFAYWEIAEQRQADLRLEPGFERLVLRVHDVELVDYNGSNSNSSFDIPIQFSDNSWYIYLPHPDCSYLFELGYICRQGYRILARSNVIRTPRGAPCAPPDPEMPEIHDMEAVYAVGSSFDAIPQRISAPSQE